MKSSPIRRIWILFISANIAVYACVLNRFRWRGLHHVPASGGVLIASNHISAFDTVLLPVSLLSRFPFQMIWAPAKEELFRNRLLGWFFRSLGAFPVRRRRDIKATAHIGKLLESEKVMIFPEGTRHKDGRLGEGNRGVGKLIYDHRPVVIPVRLSGINRWRAFALGQRGQATFGEPVDFSDLLQREDGKETQIAIVQRVMAAIGALD